MKSIRNDAELLKFLSDAAETSIEQVGEMISETLDKNIEKYVYRFDYYPNVSYLAGNGHPSQQFREAFRWAKLKKQLRDLEKVMSYDSSDMEFQPEIYWHGSSVGGDARENLADILNVEGYTSSWEWKKRRPYWNITMDDLFQKKGIEREFGRALRPLGFSKTR